MHVSRVTITMGRKFVPPGGDRFQPHEVSVSVEGTLTPEDHDQTCMSLLRDICKSELLSSIEKESE